MNHAFRALVWEQVWKNRIVFPVLTVLLVLGACLTGAMRGTDPDAWWVPLAWRTLTIAFLASVLLSFAPFTLTESPHGWRMSSMITRWFVLPVRTWLLVLIPFVAGCVVVGLFLGTWMLLLHRLVPELDVLHVLLMLLLGVAVMQTLAWILPRKPAQFWPLLALWFPALLILTLQPLDGAGWEPFRRSLRTVVPLTLPILGLVAYTAARLNRCGVWPGEIPVDGLLQWLRSGGPPLPTPRSPAGALFGSDVAPVVRTFVATWVGFLLMVLGLQVFQFLHRSNSASLTLGLVMQVVLVLIPPLGVVWLAVGGLLLGTEPGAGFRTSLSTFRAVRPVSAGSLAAQRVCAAAILWFVVWVPWLCLVTVHAHLHPKWAQVDIPALYAGSGRLMALSAHALVGALPLFLWGRLEGFPNLLLAAMAAWAGTWSLASFLPSAGGGEPLWLVMILLLAIKVSLAMSGLVWAWSAGHVTWRYPAILLGTWMLGVGLLAWVLPTWNREGWWGLGIVALFLPLARLAWAPLAVAANRHR